MRQSLAFSRMSRNAACASATASSSTSPSAVSPGAGFALALTMTSSWRGPAPGGGMPGNGPRGADGSCCSVRYLSTKPAMPRSLSHSATLTPSLSKPSTRSAPPGAITAAAPVATARVRQEHGQRRIADVRDHAIARRRARDRFRNRPMLRARRSVRPETNFRLRAHWRDGGECDAGAENEVAAAHPHCFFSAARAETRSKNSKIAGQTIGTMLPWLPSTSR